MRFICDECGKEIEGSRKSLNMHKRWNHYDLKPHLDYSGEKNPNWRGGKSLDKFGYPIQSVKGVFRFKHRIIMEKHLGRRLSKEEVIHHINGNKMDNRIENLKILTQGEHCRIENFGIRYKGIKKSKESIRKRVETVLKSGVFKGKNNPNYKNGNYIKYAEIQRVISDY